MALRVNVPGAADSGTKFRPVYATERKADWKCPQCGLEQRGYWTRCLTVGCNEKRP